MNSRNTIARAHCNQCGPNIKHKIINSHEANNTFFSDNQYEINFTTNYMMLECCGCEDVVFMQHEWNSENDWSDPIYFPPRFSRKKPRWFDDLPQEYKPLLNEIYAAVQVDSRSLALMGLRAILDLFISKKIPNNTGFAKGLDALLKKNFITPQSKETLLAAIDAGNAAAHRAYCPTAEILNTVMDIVEHLLQYDLLAKTVDGLKSSTPKRQKI